MSDREARVFLTPDTWRDLRAIAEADGEDVGDLIGLLLEQAIAAEVERRRLARRAVLRGEP